MSELKVYGMNDPKVGDEYEMYKVSEVDAVLAEKDAKIEELESNERRLKRALYKACANWAQRQHLDYYHQLHLGVPKSLLPGLEKGIDCWKKMERKCRAMAEKYK